MEQIGTDALLREIAHRVRLFRGNPPGNEVVKWIDSAPSSPTCFAETSSIGGESDLGGGIRAPEIDALGKLPTDP